MKQLSNASHLKLADDGAQHFPGAALGSLDDICVALNQLPRQRAGVRIYGIAALRPILGANGTVGSVAAAFLGDQCRPVRAILFDKTAETNWSLAWHQDRTICVKQRIEVENYGPWTIKRGIQHVAPPFELLSRMVTLRVHIDDVPENNSPLLIAPGSHKAGRVPIDEYDEVVLRCGIFACLANAGDVWAYATPILHASETSDLQARRRVFQIDYSADELAGALEWLGV